MSLPEFFPRIGIFEIRRRGGQHCAFFVLLVFPHQVQLVAAFEQDASLAAAVGADDTVLFESLEILRAGHGDADAVIGVLLPEADGEGGV